MGITRALIANWNPPFQNSRSATADAIRDEMTELKEDITTEVMVCRQLGDSVCVCVLGSIINDQCLCCMALLYGRL